MNPPRVSVIALTRDRPDDFRNLLLALAQQRLADFEVIVVGARARVEDHGAPQALARRITYARCPAQNISLSRNIGLGLAQGEIVAFIDDDAAPEPGWLSDLVKAFDAKDVGGAAGFVRGRNGVDFQWRGAVVDRYGGHAPLTRDDLTDPRVGGDNAEFFLSTVGANNAFRREALDDIGGFDENFHYFLDESDVCIRLQNAGWRIVIRPDAEVHHAYSQSAARHPNRAPRDLFEIAASRAYFSRRYGHDDWIDAKLTEFGADQEARLTKFVQLGRLSRRQAAIILDRVEEGLAEGERRFRAGPRIGQRPAGDRIVPAEAVFRPAGGQRRPRAALIVAGLSRRAVARAARRLAEQGCEVTVVDFEYRAKRLRVWFAEGVWRHVGGVLGRDRFGEPLPFPRRYVRAKRELDRVAGQRDFDVVIRPEAPRYRIGDLRVARLTGKLRGYVAEPLRPGGAQPVVEMLD